MLCWARAHVHTFLRRPAFNGVHQAVHQRAERSRSQVRRLQEQLNGLQLRLERDEARLAELITVLDNQQDQLAGLQMLLILLVVVACLALLTRAGCLSRILSFIRPRARTTALKTVASTGSIPDASLAATLGARINSYS